jgi:hypothetical protein
MALALLVTKQEDSGPVVCLFLSLVVEVIELIRLNPVVFYLCLIHELRSMPTLGPLSFVLRLLVRQICPRTFVLLCLCPLMFAILFPFDHFVLF